MRLEADVAVVGGGPAGATLAALLASFGRSVVLLHRESARESMPEEVLVPGSRKVLARTGVLDLLEPLLGPGPARMGVIWAEDRIRWREIGEGERGFQVVRADLDQTLRTDAARKGARVVPIHSLRGPIGGAGESALWARTRNGPEIEIRARVVAAATGRMTSPVILPIDVADALPETVALVATGPLPAAWAGGSVIEAVPEGWWWWLPLRSGAASLALMTDAEQVSSQGRAVTWNAARAHAKGPARDSDAMPATGAVATARLLTTTSESVLVGDAAGTVDPLSSQGLEKAFFSAHEAALAINTMLDDPAAATAIRNHLQARARGVFEAHARRALELYAEERRFEDSSFWQERHAAAARRSAPDTEPPREGERIAPHPALHRSVAYQPAGRRLVAVTGFRIDPASEALDTVGEVPLEALMSAIAGGGTPREILDRAARSPALFRLTPRTILEALSRLVGLGFVSVKQPRPRT